VSDEMEDVLKLVGRIDKKAATVVEPLAREMRLMAWPPEFRIILLNEIIGRLQRLRTDAENEIDP